MARTAATAITPKGPYPASLAADGAEITWTVGDVANGNTVPWVGQRMLLLVKNTSADTDYYVTVASIADRLGRTSDVLTQYDVDFGEQMAFVLEREGWQQADGALYLNFENAALYFAVLAL